MKDQEYLDPRVRRTRQMLENALQELLVKKPFEKISVGDIAESATLNRATFYAHYMDKFDLLEGMVASQFQGLLLKSGVLFDGTCPSALYGIALAVCDFLADLPFCSEQRQISQHLELAMVRIVRGMIADGLGKHEQNSSVDAAMLAAVLAGAIYGAAKQWVRTADRPGAEQAAASIMKLLAPMLATS